MSPDVFPLVSRLFQTKREKRKTYVNVSHLRRASPIFGDKFSDGEPPQHAISEHPLIDRIIECPVELH